MIRLLLIITLIAAAVRPVRAEELSLLGGMMSSLDSGEGSYSWQLEYREHLSDHFSVSLSYLNEGHVPDHHRDGHALALWTGTNLFQDRLTLAIGAGPYFYFDTTAAKAGGDYKDNHGWGALFSLAATWHTQSDWLLQLRANGVKTENSIDTFSVLAGVGLYLEPGRTGRPATKMANDRTKRGRNELTCFLGQTIVNSFSSDKSVAVSIEYRRRLAKYLDGTIGWIYEGDNRLIRRNGVSLQLWGVKDYLDKRISVGVGAGGYISIDRYYDLQMNQQRDLSSVSGIVTLTTSYLVNPKVGLRISWHRIVTNYDRDTDVLMGGVGYRF